MASDSSPAFFRLNSVDRLGRKISPAVLIAAEEVFSRAIEHGLKMSCDPAVVANVLEEVAADVSRRLDDNNGNGDRAPIKNVPGYVFHAFVRHLNRLISKELVLVREADSRQVTSSTRTDPSSQIETKILLQECLGHFDFVTRDMFWRCVQGFTWEDIGKIHGLSGHAAEVRFRRAVKTAQARITNERRSLPCRTDRNEQLKPAMPNDAKKQTTGI
jgi:hypothetical protein